MTHEARKLLELETSLLSERLRSLETAHGTERARHARERGVVKLHKKRSDELAAELEKQVAAIAIERERAVSLEACAKIRWTSLGASMRKHHASMGHTCGE